MSEKLVSTRQYTREFKMEAIRLAESVGQRWRPICLAPTTADRGGRISVFKAG